MAERTSSEDLLLVNGHAKMNGVIDKLDMELQRQENIFLFVPNIIGKFIPSKFKVVRRADARRLLPNYPCYCFTLLYAPPSSNLFPTLQRFMSA